MHELLRFHRRNKCKCIVWIPTLRPLPTSYNVAFNGNHSWFLEIRISSTSFGALQYFTVWKGKHFALIIIVLIILLLRLISQRNFMSFSNKQYLSRGFMYYNEVTTTAINNNTFTFKNVVLNYIGPFICYSPAEVLDAPNDGSFECEFPQRLLHL